MAQQLLLELIALLDVCALPQLLDQPRQDGLGGQVPRMAEYLIRVLLYNAHRLQFLPSCDLVRWDEPWAYPAGGCRQLGLVYLLQLDLPQVVL